MRTETVDDIVLDILDRIALKVGAVTPRVARQLEKEIRNDWGGERPYIAKIGENARTERLQRNIRIRDEARHGTPIPVIARRHGVSEKRVRQIIAAGNDLP